jgi:predicted Zn-dependent protease with MMP-like domain
VSGGASPQAAPDPDRLIRIAADAVGAAQRRLPPPIRTLARGVAVHYERLPAEDVIADGFPPDILGLFTGAAHGTELSADHPAPPQILLYLDNLWDFAEADEALFREEAERTYLHELGHYLGWDEDEVAARGLD